ncbi:ABC transporter substrate-binding protein [Roseovarius sp.]|uniref:ABC transporter substrate-binding protein n=1 Tax=Roseovarius sp. TaxID=1486281 RepID=UPI00356A099A
MLGNSKPRSVASFVRAAGLAALLGIAATGAQAQDTITIQTDWAPHGMHAGLLLAVEKGWFAEVGLDVDVQDGRGSNATIQQVAAGQLDIGFAQLGAMASAIDSGMPITSIMGFVRAGDNGLMVPRDSGWTTLEDLKGKRIAVPAGGATAAFTDAFLEAGGMSRNDFDVINVDSSAMVSTYTSGGADAVLSTVAFFKPIVESARPSEGILFSDVGLRVPGYGLVVLRETADEMPEPLGTFVEVQQRTWEYIFEGNEEEAVDAIISQRPDMRLDREVMLGQLKAYMPLFNTPNTEGKPIGWQSEQDWIDALEAMETAGLISSGWTVDDYFTNRFVSEQ